MLCPKTSDLEPPLYFTENRWDNCRSKFTTQLVDSHYFNHSVSIVLPDTVTVPDTIRNCLSEDTDYYRVKALRACDLVNGEFIEAFVKKGEISLLTIGRKIDLHNSVCVTPTGYLLLSLLIEDYQALGLEGKASFLDHKPHSRYGKCKIAMNLRITWQQQYENTYTLSVITINLKNEKFVPGTKYYERVRTALEQRLKQTFDVIITWDPPKTNLCPSSIAAWFCARNYDVCLCHQKFVQRTKYSMTIPTVQEFISTNEIFEWLGIFCIGGDLSGEKTDKYVNTYEYLASSIEVGQVQHLQWTGFFTRKKMNEIYDVLKEYVLTRKTLPWISLNVQGFLDSLTSWCLKEHTFLMDGDNSYTVIFTPTGDCMTQKSYSSSNKPRCK